MEYTDGLKRKTVERAAIAYLAEKGYKEGFTLTVELDGWSVKSATLNFSDLGMPENTEHINKSEIIKLVADYFGIGEEAIMSYG